MSDLKLSTYVGGLGDYDQGTHLLIGEDKFRGRHRCKFFCYVCVTGLTVMTWTVTAVMTAMKHACFLRDPRTDVVVGEPRHDLPIVPRLKLFLPQEFNRVGVPSTTFNRSGQLTVLLDRNSSSLTRGRCTSCSDATGSSKLLRCTRTKKSRFQRSTGLPIRQVE